VDCQHRPSSINDAKALAEQSCCCCADVCSRLPLAQSTVSQHLKVLREAGLVSFRRDGVRSSYVLNPDALAALRSDLAVVTALLAAVRVPAARSGAR
jgi:ArsR family transcriptional regulator